MLGWAGRSKLIENLQLNTVKNQLYFASKVGLIAYTERGKSIKLHPNSNEKTGIMGLFG